MPLMLKCSGISSFSGNRGIAVGFMGLFSGVEEAEINVAPIVSNASHPFSRSLVPLRTLQAASVRPRFFRVGHVLRTGRLSQVAEAIVGRVSVNVINVMIWPFAMGIKPRKSVCSIWRSVHSYDDVACSVYPASMAGRRSSSFASGSWRKNPAPFVISKKSFEALLRQWRPCSAVCSFAEIANSIIETISVDVNEFVCWPLMVFDKPYKARNWVILAINANSYVSLASYCPCDASGACLPARHFPYKPSAALVVIQECANEIKRGVCRIVSHCGCVLDIGGYVNSAFVGKCQ